MWSPRAAVDGAAAGIDQQAAIEGVGLGALMQAERRIERRLGRAVRDQLDRLEQSAAANVADMGMIAEAVGQQRHQPRARAPARGRAALRPE